MWKIVNLGKLKVYIWHLKCLIFRNWSVSIFHPFEKKKNMRIFPIKINIMVGKFFQMLNKIIRFVQ